MKRRLLIACPCAVGMVCETSFLDAVFSDVANVASDAQVLGNQTLKQFIVLYSGTMASYTWSIGTAMITFVAFLEGETTVLTSQGSGK